MMEYRDNVIAHFIESAANVITISRCLVPRFEYHRRLHFVDCRNCALEYRRLVPLNVNLEEIEAFQPDVSDNRIERSERDRYAGFSKTRKTRVFGVNRKTPLAVGCGNRDLKNLCLA